MNGTGEYTALEFTFSKHCFYFKTGASCTTLSLEGTLPRDLNSPISPVLPNRVIVRVHSTTDTMKADSRTHKPKVVVSYILQGCHYSDTISSDTKSGNGERSWKKGFASGISG